MSQREASEPHPLESEIGHCFRDPDLLRAALTHTSFWNEYPDAVDSDNQRLEFLGDAVLDLLVAHHLYQRWPPLSEGEMTALRAMHVRQESLAGVAVALHIDKYILLGRGEEDSGGRERAANLCGALEAVVGALYLDAGLDVVRRWVLSAIERQGETKPDVRDPKSLLQEWAQARLRVTPTYRTVAAEGPDHAKRFTVEAVLGSEVCGSGEGASKQAAAQLAARDALTRLGADRRGTENSAGKGPQTSVPRPGALRSSTDKADTDGQPTDSR